MPLPHIYVILPNLVVLRPTVRALLSAGNNLTLCVLSMSLKVIGTDRDHGSISYDFLLTFHSNHKPISYCFHDKRRFRSKIAFFPPRCIWRHRSKEFTWVPALGVKKTRIMVIAYRSEKEVWRYIQPSGYNTRTYWTDGQTDTGRQPRPRSRIASCGRNNLLHRKAVYTAIFHAVFYASLCFFCRTCGTPEHTDPNSFRLYSLPAAKLRTCALSSTPEKVDLEKK